MRPVPQLRADLRKGGRDASRAAFVKVNTEQEQELAAHFQIRSIPTLMVFREQVLLFAQPGMLPESALADLMARVNELDMAQVHKEIAEQEASAASA